MAALSTEIPTRSLMWVWICTLAHAAATLWHHVHNAIYLSAYPNMPEGLTASGVYAAWATVTAIGAVGAALIHFFRRITLGLCVLAVYGATGWDGLAHYAVADFSAHSTGMHVSILMEASTATVLVLVIAATLVHARANRARAA